MNTSMLEGKRAVVTGGGRDFGRAVAIWLAREGVKVDLCARSLEDARQTCDDIRSEGHVARPHHCDLTEPETITSFVAALRQDETPVDFLILSAAQWLEGDLGDGKSHEEIVSTITSGLTGSILLTDMLLPYLKEGSNPAIIAMVSSCGRPGYTGSVAHPAFYAAKHGLSGFVGILAERLVGDGIKVCGFYPPDFETRDPITETEAAPTALLQADTIWQAIRLTLLSTGVAGPDAVYFNGPTRAELEK